ncbi:MAG: hypothetical protein HC880_13605, partial [Bacteroidia bacterium]|nr:hypothetical protein [Bacteroidia bacterium]
YRNALHFHFSSAEYAGAEFVRYRYQLEGYESKWSPWTTQQTKEYTNLPPGLYTFRIQAKGPEDEESPVLSYRFRIMPPWYASNLAYVIYSLLGLLMLALFARYLQSRFSKLKQAYQKTEARSQEEIDRLRSEKIEAELKYKQRELVTTTMHLVKKNETLEEIKDRIESISKKSKDEKTAHELYKLIGMLKQEEVLDEGWEQFTFHFNQLHGDFFKQLKEKYPQLTPKDMKLCAYLKMNLTTKEIASLMNITVRGVEASRYRLRKKFDLDAQANLTDFLMGF